MFPNYFPGKPRTDWEGWLLQPSYNTWVATKCLLHLQCIWDIINSTCDWEEVHYISQIPTPLLTSNRTLLWEQSRWFQWHYMPNRALCNRSQSDPIRYILYYRYKLVFTCIYKQPVYASGSSIYKSKKLQTDPDPSMLTHYLHDTYTYLTTRTSSLWYLNSLYITLPHNVTAVMVPATSVWDRYFDYGIQSGASLTIQVENVKSPRRYLSHLFLKDKLHTLSEEIHKFQAKTTLEKRCSHYICTLSAWGIN